MLRLINNQKHFLGVCVCVCVCDGGGGSVLDGSHMALRKMVGTLMAWGCQVNLRERRIRVEKDESESLSCMMNVISSLDRNSRGRTHLKTGGCLLIGLTDWSLTRPHLQVLGSDLLVCIMGLVVLV